MAFGLFAGLATLYALLSWQSSSLSMPPQSWQTWLGSAVVGVGLAGVTCSIMIYVCTRRPFWSGTATTIKFLLTTLWLGTVAVLATELVAALVTSTFAPALVMQKFGGVLCKAVLLIAAAKLLHEASLFSHLLEKPHTPLKRSARLLTGPLLKWTLARFACGLIGGIAIPAMLTTWNATLATIEASPPFSSGQYLAAISGLCVFSIAGELLERYLFFTAAVAPKMPGGVHP